MTRHECLQKATKAQANLDKLLSRLDAKINKLNNAAKGAIDAAREEVEMWMQKAAAKDPPIDTINAPPEYRTAEEIAQEGRR